LEGAAGENAAEGAAYARKRAKQELNFIFATTTVD
jgi:hypothetical protein